MLLRCGPRLLDRLAPHIGVRARVVLAHASSSAAATGAGLRSRGLPSPSARLPGFPRSTGLPSCQLRTVLLCRALLDTDDMPQPPQTADVTYLTAAEARALDEELMGPLGFSVDQLMELAGLAVAAAVAEEWPAASHPRVLVLAGPGNNGGDGLVAARHLHHFGYSVSVCYPKPTDRPLYAGLVTQCRSLGLAFLGAGELGALGGRYDVVVDALFGFSFTGQPRPPFDAIIQLLARLGGGASGGPVLVSVDIPSGWDVEAGDESGAGLRPDMLVSLTTPKLCARRFTGAHLYLGGRFVPPQIVERYRLRLPRYPGAAQCVRIGGSAAGAAPGLAGMRRSYGTSCGGLLESEVASDPVEQFGRWFEEAQAAGEVEPNAMALATAAPDGSPSVRYVLLKGVSPRGFEFYTNYESRKAGELTATGRAALAFWWGGLQRQVRVEGHVERLPAAESDAYFASRPRGSQLGALVSQQSRPVPGGRRQLEALAAGVESVYGDPSTPVPRPEEWGGFLVRPLSVEFWQGRPSRLHDRLVFRRSVEAERWDPPERLFP